MKVLVFLIIGVKSKLFLKKDYFCYLLPYKYSKFKLSVFLTILTLFLTHWSLQKGAAGSCLQHNVENILWASVCAALC